MNKNFLQLLITPVITVIFYLVASYIIAYIYGVSELIAYMPFSIWLPVVIFESLPVFLVSLLFAMQYSMTSVNLKNTGYALILAITMAVVKFMLIIVFFKIVKVFSENSEFMALGTYPLYLLFVALFFIAAGLVSHYYFIWTKQDINPVELEHTSLIASISYLLLLLSPPVVTWVLFVLNFNAYQYSRLISSTHFASPIYIMAFIYLFILIIFWVYDIVRAHFAFNTYATSTIKAYVFTQFSYIVLYAVLMCIGFVIITSVNPWRVIGSVPHALFITVLMVITIGLLFLMARIVKSRAYKIYHVVTCVVFVGSMYMILLNSYRGFGDATIFITAMLFSISLSLCLLAFCIRKSLKAAFK